MQLESHATTMRELLEDVVTLLLQRAKQQKEQSIYAGGIKKAEQMEYASTVLGNLAGEVKCIILRCE